MVPPEGGAAPAAAMQAAGSAADGASAPAAGVFAALADAVAAARATLTNFLDLVSFEARRAGHALFWIVAGAVVAAVLIVTAWFGLMAAFVMWVASLGYPAAAAVLAVALLNLAVGSALILGCMGMTGNLLFSASRRQLAGKSPVKPGAA
jgi:hypothetical protein